MFRPWLFLVVAVALVTGCSRRAKQLPPEDVKPFALQFVQALCQRDYPSAYAMTSRSYRTQVTLAQMQASFEQFVPQTWKVGELAIPQTLQDWPARERSDVGWAYVSIDGLDPAMPNLTAVEGVTVVVMRDDGKLAIRTVEWGRP